ncbi:hypothetical protein A5624_10185 [Mycobacterium sp. 1482292.6]|nr:hypothetical protein A5624_10185 [Mycobacterium sp. 1482292.6]OBJ19705.1 hypothetical protein A5622_20360 [Mycobacterium sp. 1245801.1]
MLCLLLQPLGCHLGHQAGGAAFDFIDVARPGRRSLVDGRRETPCFVLRLVAHGGVRVRPVDVLSITV